MYEPLPNEEERRAKLREYSKDELIDMLFIAYRNVQLAAQMATDEANKRQQLKDFLQEISKVF